MRSEPWSPPNWLIVLIGSMTGGVLGATNPPVIVWAAVLAGEVLLILAVLLVSAVIWLLHQVDGRR